MAKKLPEIMIVCLMCTVIIELVIALFLGVRKKKDILNIILVNILTNPIVVSVPFLVYLNYGILYRNITLIIFELLVLFCEGLVYKKYLNYNKINSFMLSLILNFSSYFIGIIINYFIW